MFLLIKVSHSFWINVEVEQGSIFSQKQNVCMLETNFHHANNIASFGLRKMLDLKCSSDQFWRKNLT